MRRGPAGGLAGPLLSCGSPPRETPPQKGPITRYGQASRVGAGTFREPINILIAFCACLRPDLDICFPFRIKSEIPAMRHENNLASGRITDRDLPFLFAGVVWIEKRQGQWIEEDRHCVLKRYVVFLYIGLGLGRIPLIDHRFSLPHRINRTTSELPPGTCVRFNNGFASGGIA